jgi:PAS domain-containing protein
VDARPASKHLLLILAREFAAELALAAFVSDADGRLVYFNEAAEEILGRTFAEAGELPAAEWVSTFSITDAAGRPMALEHMPAGVALLDREPAHGALRIVGLDEVTRTIEVTAFPLLAHRDEPVGVMAIFWPA